MRLAAAAVFFALGLAGGSAAGTASLPTRSCGFQSFGKGWYLRASRSVPCRSARRVFRAYFATPGCNGPAAGTCFVRPYRCRYDYRDDVERVRCAKPERLIAFRSVA
jgi:hypothetical protein